MIRPLLSAACLALLATGASEAQMPPANSPIKITDIKPSLEKSPEFAVGIGPQRKASSQDWLWVEVSFTYTAAKTAPPLDDLKLTYYILLNNADRQNPTGTLLVGSVSHTGITVGTDAHRSLMLVSPQVLRRFFGGKSPSNANTAVQAIGVTASINGQIWAENSIGKGSGKPQWWNSFQQGPPGLVLNKDQTPFGPLFYDYFEAIKPSTPGGG